MLALPHDDRLRERDDRARREARTEARGEVVGHAVGVEHELLDELEHDVRAVASVPWGAARAAQRRHARAAAAAKPCVELRLGRDRGLERAIPGEQVWT